MKEQSSGQGPGVLCPGLCVLVLSRAPFLAPLLGTGETFFPGKGDTEEELSKFQGHSEFLTLQPGLLGDGGFICGPALALAPAPPLPQLSISCL